MPEAPSLYRRHRPRTFADVVGQDHVVRTLRNAVTQDKVHHAYLFVGSRGTGKTSMAKILAACLNCERGPTIEPCGRCDSCVSIASATSLDVIEMDAASNNSVDDIRDLRDSVVYAPVSGRHKIYILDEAHMLSTQAWNAFLKTLEEPPPNTVFVLATTEAAKVLPTVVDRCHRFDFGRPTVEQLAAVVRRVAEREQIDIAPDAIALLARHATGSFRDALGTLEQLVTYAGTDPSGGLAGVRIATEDVLAVLGVADADLLFAAFDAIAAGDSRAALLAAARLTQSGRDALGFVRDLEAHARDLMIVQTLGGVPPELATTPDRDARLAEQAGRVGPGAVARLLDLLAAAMEATKNGSDARTQLELALVKAAAPAIDPSTQALLARIERLEAALRGATLPAPGGSAGAPAQIAAPPASSPPPPPSAAAPPASSPSPSSPSAAVPLASSPPPSAAAPVPTEASRTSAPVQGGEPAPSSSPVVPPVGGDPGPSEPYMGPAYGEDPGPAEPYVPPEHGGDPGPAEPYVPRSEARDAGPAASYVPRPQPGDPAPAPAEPRDGPPAAVATVADVALELESLRAVWLAVIDGVRSGGNAMCAALLLESRPHKVDGTRVTIAFPSDGAYNLRKADDEEYRACVADTIRALTGERPQIEYVLADEPVAAAEPQAPPTDREWVDRFVAEFDAEEIHPESEAT